MKVGKNGKLERKGVGFCILFCQKKLPLIEIQNFLEFNEF
jgi:hypothetical protein